MKVYNEPFTGCLLVSDPFLRDPSFTRSVVLVVEHGEEGTVGFVLTQPMGLWVNELGVAFSKIGNEVYSGGPVSRDSLHYIHAEGAQIKEAVTVNEGIYWSGEFEDLDRLADEGMIGEANARFFLGYSGWGPEQLLEEVQEKAWIVIDATSDFVFGTDPQHLWRSIMEHLGGKYKLFINAPVDPRLN